MGCCQSVPTTYVQMDDVNVHMHCHGDENVAHDFMPLGVIECITLCTLVRSSAAPLELIVRFDDVDIPVTITGAFVTSRIVLYSEPNLTYALHCGVRSTDTIESLRTHANEDGSPVQNDMHISQCTADESLRQFERLLPQIARRSFTLLAPKNAESWTGTLTVRVLAT
jgi:hypothetical protein